MLTFETTPTEFGIISLNLYRSLIKKESFYRQARFKDKLILSIQIWHQIYEFDDLQEKIKLPFMYIACIKNIMKPGLYNRENEVTLMGTEFVLFY